MKKITLILFTLVCSFGFAQTFTSDASSDPGTYPADMQNGTGNTNATCGTANELFLPSTVVSGVGTLGTTNILESVTLNVSHTWNDDIKIGLEDPSGAVIVLLTENVGGTGDGFENLVLQDGATPLPDSGSSPLTGTYAPLGVLADFNGGTINGDGVWNLLVCDDAGGDTGTVLNWSITFAPTPMCTDPAATFTIEEDCGSNEFSVEVNVTDLGSFNEVNVSDNQSSMAQTVNMAMTTVIFGPYTSDTSIIFEIAGDDPNCTINETVSFQCPPPNDNFAGAIPITPSAEGTGCSTATFNLPFSTDGTSDSGMDGTCSGSDTGLDQFFSWTATSDGLLFNSATPGFPGIVVRDAVTMAEIDCAGTFAADAVLFGWTVGQDLIIQIYDFEGAPNDVAFCLEEFTVPESPANDSCATAEVVDGLPYTQDLDATAATNNDGFISCDGEPSHANDGVWYTFTPSQAGEIDIEISNVVGWDPELRVYGGSCGAFTCVGFADSGLTGDGESIFALPVMAFEQYWINVAYWSGATDGAEGPFTIDITGTAVLGTDDLTLNSDIRLFPNPATDVLNISGLNETSKVSIFNLLGQKVLTSDSNVINVSSLSNGMYIVNIESENASKTLRFVKN